MLHALPEPPHYNSMALAFQAEKGRLGEEDIARMVKEAEEFRQQDMLYAEKVDAPTLNASPR